MAYDLALIVNPEGRTLPAELVQRCSALCEAEGIPPEGITIMGGKPYINVTGLDNKVRRRAEAEKLVFAGCTAEDQSPQMPGGRREFKGVLTYFDAAHFTEALKSGPMTPESIQALRAAYTYTYTDVGSCSMKTAKMSTMQNEDNIAMLASRRATNRAKRAATGVGLTSIDEVVGEIQDRGAMSGASTVTPPKPKGKKEPAGAAVVDAEFSPVVPEEAPPAPAASASDVISGKDASRIWAALYVGAKTEEDKAKRLVRLKDWLQDQAPYVIDAKGLAHASLIKVADYQAALDAAGGVAFEEGGG